MKTRITVAITGASGVILGKRLVEFLKNKENAKKYETHLVISGEARQIAEYEDVDLDAVEDLADYVYEDTDLAANISSSSYPMDAMVIVPCSLKTLSAVANGLCDNLINRAAENMLKLGKTLVVVPRDTPLSLPALENMARLRASGALIVPPVMAYYYKPKTVDDVTSFFVGKILDCMKIEHNLYKRWYKTK